VLKQWSLVSSEQVMKQAVPSDDIVLLTRTIAL
jgi:hypothetical protein